MESKVYLSYATFFTRCLPIAFTLETILAGKVQNGEIRFGQMANWPRLIILPKLPRLMAEIGEVARIAYVAEIAGRDWRGWSS